MAADADEPRPVSLGRPVGNNESGLKNGVGRSVHDRVSADQARFRRANDDLEGRYVGLLATGAVPFICECADERCTRVISLTLEDYAEIRSHPGRFVVVPGHHRPHDEDVVGEGADYAVVEKRRGDGVLPEP